MHTKKYKIFSFVDFSDGIPPYLSLCIQTWKKCFEDKTEIVLLNKDNVKNYIDAYLLTESVINPLKCNIQMFYDYMALLVLYCNGGIFMDADTIITDGFEPDFSVFSNYETCVFSDTDLGVCCGFLMAERYSSVIEELIRRYRFENYLPERNIFRNSIFQDVLKKNNKDKILFYDAKCSGYIAEAKFTGSFSKNIYRNYYFTNKVPIEYFLKNTSGVTALHNSLTPKVFQRMSKEELLSQDILLSKIFKVLL